MKFATSFMTGLAAVGSVAAAPLAKRDHSGDESGNGINDAVVLQYALTLEQSVTSSMPPRERWLTTFSP